MYCIGARSVCSKTARAQVFCIGARSVCSKTARAQVYCIGARSVFSKTAREQVYCTVPHTQVALTDDGKEARVRSVTSADVSESGSEGLLVVAELFRGECLTEADGGDGVCVEPVGKADEGDGYSKSIGSQSRRLIIFT